MGRHSSTAPAGHALFRLAVVGAVALGVPVAVADTAQAGSGGRWDRLAKCESGGRWSTNTGNGYYGGLQFSRSTWKAHGGTGMPHRASRSEQIRVAQRVLRTQGWKAWPVCSRKLGLR
jgi:resuscitation-promoting factor RpfA